MQIGIVGQGFVGSAIREGLKKYYPVIGYDLDPGRCYALPSSHDEGLQDIVRYSDIVFVCVPTPMRKDGSCDTRILENAIEDFVTEFNEQLLPESDPTTPIVVIKSTVPPGTTQRIADKYGENLRLCFSPEFLTEANSIEDFKNQSRIIIGGDGAREVKRMFRKAFPKIPIVITKSETAEMVKYFINCFLATKVTFANQMYEICQAADIDYDKVCEYALHDTRIGKSHLAVPGPDGDFGFGGHCFPKDLAAMSFFGENFHAETGLLKEIEALNNYYRSNKDWEKMKGRAVSDD